jgi:molybdopterin molybdotransferase
VSRRFDRIIVVDWSARSTPSPRRPSADAVWIGTAGEGAGEPVYCRTRAEAEALLAAILSEAAAAGQRVLAGFDFPFGYPAGFAAAVTGRAEALALWERLADVIEDGPENANNRFKVADAINARLPGTGPFWGRPAGLVLAALPERGSDRTGHGFAERRLVERAVPRAQPCWKLYTTGSVGGQALVGLPALERLRRDPRWAERIKVWPFESGLAPPEAEVVLAEVYPSLLDGAVATARAAEGGVRDAAQVAVTAAALARLDAAGELAALFAGPAGLGAAERAAVEREEGWILGAGHEAALAAAARAATAPPLRDDCFALPPGVDWVPVDVALERLRAGLGPVTGEETVPLPAALGRVLAQGVRAARAHPPYANAAVDGYGFARECLGEGPHDLPLVEGRAAAGRPHSGAVPAGAALRVLTGAALPEGVDTVVLDEDTAAGAGRVAFARAPKRGANTRPRGEDVAEGAEVLAAGRVLRPQDLALAASVGLGALPVRRRLRVAVLSTGDELRPPGEAVAGHQIHDANRPMLLGLVARWGMVPVDLGQAPDRADAVAAALDRGAGEADAILTSGGASAGDEDHLSRLLRARGRLDTWRIAVKPGRPLALGLWRGVPVVGLPGNPVAAFVCTLVFARPALFALAGAPWSAPEGFVVPAGFSKAKKPGRREYLRARIGPDGRAEVFASEGSGRVSGLAWAEGLVELPDAAGRVAPGDPVRYLPFAAFGV